MTATFQRLMDEYPDGLQYGNSKQFADSQADDKNHSVQDGLTALAGGGQDGATAILAPRARFTTVASGGDSAILPAAGGDGQTIIVINDGASSMDVYPQDNGDQIDKAGANTAVAVANAKRRLFTTTSLGVWSSLLGA